jgi:hypothetical protein
MPTSVETMYQPTRFRYLATLLYWVAGFLVVFPLVDSIMAVTPMRPGDAGWRFGAMGIFSRALMTPILGLSLLLVVATAREQWRVVRGAAVLSGVVATVLLVALALFGLDALQVRGRMPAQAQDAFDVATAIAAAKYVGALVFLFMVTYRAWKASRVKNKGPGHTSPLIGLDQPKPQMHDLPAM